MMNRKQFLDAFEGEVRDGGIEGARRLGASWLRAWPNDGDVVLALARLESQSKLHGSAIRRLKEQMERDPEFEEIYEELAKAFEASEDPIQAATHRACLAALRADLLDPDDSPRWAKQLAQAVKELQRGDGAAAAVSAHQALLADISLPLPFVLAFRARRLAGQKSKAIQLARAGLDRWPDVVLFRLAVALDELKNGNPEWGVGHLHQAAALDPLGRVADSYLGADNPYRRMWPTELTASIVVGTSLPSTGQEEGVQAKQPVGAQGSSEGNPAPESLPSESPQSAMPRPEPWESFRGPDPGDELPLASLTERWTEVRSEFNRIAKRLRIRLQPKSVDTGVPAYIVLASKTRMLQEMAASEVARIEEAASALVKAIRSRPGWNAHLVFMDDPGSLQRYGLRPVDPSNAWQIKLRLGDLDESLRQRGQRVGALLILGDHSIVPFHMLPNPTDDEDPEVPSDNPYATRDENYFAPEWPVGRLPSRDPDLLSRSLRAAAQEHELAVKAPDSSARFRTWLASNFGRFFGLRSQSFGYTASIWKKSSMVVFRTIGEPGRLVSSPPVVAESIPAAALRPSLLSYYNLHGLEDAPEWYGQRDPVRDGNTPEEFPVALRVEDVVNGGRAPKIVYTEACYGANTLDKDQDTALALRFLDRGSHAVVGSTKISYGSVTPPLIGADLLGHHFWQTINEGLPVGEALRRAKLDLAAEMHERQGYLDGEDQKAVISFVLYGDPLYAPRNLYPVISKKNVSKRQRVPKATMMKTACARGGPDLASENLDREAQARVKSIVSRYLPGMEGAICRIHTQHHGRAADDHVCPSHQVGMKGLAQGDHQPMVVTLSKSIQSGSRRHPHYARLTLDSAGKVLKLAVSR
jgi:hypothetical protein